eukprot:snap_masked-scaffold_86-processed-gene-0.9-mRNA-1 protein AED:1.00 eAED:1.00 QI:0/0/0/0/1/1/2/0/127
MKSKKTCFKKELNKKRIIKDRQEYNFHLGGSITPQKSAEFSTSANSPISYGQEGVQSAIALIISSMQTANSSELMHIIIFRLAEGLLEQISLVEVDELKGEKVGDLDGKYVGFRLELFSLEPKLKPI